MIFNMSGGGGTAAGLNFKVVGGTSVPSNPTANTIWVNTGASITSWHFGAEEPNVWKASLIDASDLCGLRVNRTLSDGDILNITIPVTVDVSWIHAIRISDISGNLYYVRNSDGTAISSWAAGNKVGLRISNTKYPINGQGNNGGSAIVVASNGYYHDAGVVWISTGTSSTAPFYALKKNNITVYPMSAKQYVSGAWVDKQAKSYQNGAWVEWWDATAWIYHNSREYTGTWSAKAWARKSDGSTSKYTPSLSFGGMGMNFSYGGYVEAVGTVCNDALLDLSDKTKITVVIASASSNASELNMIVTDALKDGYNSLASKEKVTAAGTYTIDVSSISSGYFVFHMYNIGEYAISSIRIE